MINTICGTIKSISGNDVQVTIPRKAACQGCQAADICHSLSRPNMDFRLPKPSMSVKEGDRVTIALESMSFIRACFYAFFIPLCAILLALFITSMLDLAEAIQAISAVAAFLVSLIFVRKLGKKIDNPRIIEVISED